MKTSNFWLSLILCVGVLISACGDDESSSKAEQSKPSGEIEHPAKDTDVDNKVSDETFIRSKIYDASIGTYLNTIQFGIYIWMEDNVTDAHSDISMCYDNDPENCYAYGRLYNSWYSSCPVGFSVPTKDDWSRTLDYLENAPEIDSIFGFSKGGFCQEGQKGVSCSEKDDAGYYFAGSTSVAVVKGHSVSFLDSIEDSFYQLRCVKYSYIAATVEDLPECDSMSQNTLRPFYVMSEKSNFKCSGMRWVNDFTNNCSHVGNGASAVYNDTMYICKSNEWQVANISDSRDPCTAKNDRTTYLFNGVYYACEDSSWRMFNSLELELGYCKPSLEGTIDSLIFANKPTYYVCDSAGWRATTMSDFVGKCDSAHLYEMNVFNGVDYICRNNKWEALNVLEQELGACTPKKQGQIDTTKAGVDYICDSAEWRYAGWIDYIGECNSSRLNKKESYANNTYVCLENGWHELSVIEYELGICTKEKQGAIDTAENSKTYICDSLEWRTTVIEDYGGKCDSTILYKKIFYNKNEYYCGDSSWKKMTSVDSTLGLCTNENNGECGLVEEYYYCCSSKWVKTEEREARFGKCTSSREGEIIKDPNIAYKCTKNKWQNGSVTEYMGPCDSTKAGLLVYYIGKYYSCRNELTKERWLEVSSGADGYFGFCSGRNQFMMKQHHGERYFCSSNPYWSDLGTAFFPMCDSTSTPGERKRITGGGCGYLSYCEYVCDYPTYGEGWKQLDRLDSASGSYCSEATLGKIVTIDDGYTPPENQDKYICDNSLSYYRWIKYKKN